MLSLSTTSSEAAFVIAPVQMNSLLEIPYIILAGVLIGCVASGFNLAVQLFSRLAHWPFWLRALFAGAITGQQLQQDRCGDDGGGKVAEARDIGKSSAGVAEEILQDEKRAHVAEGLGQCEPGQ